MLHKNIYISAPHSSPICMTTNISLQVVAREHHLEHHGIEFKLMFPFLLQFHQSRSFDTSQHLGIRRFIVYWNGRPGWQTVTTFTKGVFYIILFALITRMNVYLITNCLLPYPGWAWIWHRRHGQWPPSRCARSDHFHRQRSQRRGEW